MSIFCQLIICVAAVWGLQWDDNGDISFRTRAQSLLLGCTGPKVSTEALILRELGGVHDVIEKESVFFQNPSINKDEKSKHIALGTLLACMHITR